MTTPADTTVPTTEPRSHDGTTPWTQRTVEAITARLSTTRMGRRRFLTRAALVGSALAVDPIGFVLKPRTAWATVCGDDNEFADGWSAFCATINDGANTCPTGSFVAGWWKIDNTTFCNGRARYIVDCNRTPGSSCSCRAADGECDRRRVCCNNFRYGQCNTQIRGTTEVVCRIVLCTPPWEWGNCTTTSLTSNQTRTHWSSRLPSRTNPTPIMVYWLEDGLTASRVGDIIGSERDAPDGGSWARFDNGVLTAGPGGTVRQLTGPHADAYARLDGPEGPLGSNSRNVSGTPQRAVFANGSTYLNGRTAYGVWDQVDDGYRARGGPNGWMGPPVQDVLVKNGYVILDTASGWKLVWSTTRRELRVLRSVSSMPGNGEWPATASVRRWSGSNRYETAVEVSRRAYPDGAELVLVARGDDYPDATAAGAVSARLQAPVLLTRPDGLPDAIAAEIRRLGASRAVVLGGTSAIEGSVVSALEQLGLAVDRWSGANRYETAVAVSRNAFPNGSSKVVLATGVNFPDALAVAPEAHRMQAPVLLLGRRGIPGAVSAELRRLAPSRALLVGGSNAIGTSVAARIRDEFGISTTRVSGRTRYATSGRIAERLGGDPDRVVFTTGKKFPDALAVSSWVDPRAVPILLADGGIDAVVDDEMRRRRPREIIVVGGRSAVPGELAEQLGGYRL